MRKSLSLRAFQRWWKKKKPAPKPRKGLNRRAFLAGLMLAGAVMPLTLHEVKAWFPHGVGSGGPPPTTPQWPPAVAGYTNYWVSSPTDPTWPGNDSNNGLTQATAWATPTKVNAGPGGGYGSGNVAINFLSTYSYLCPSGGSLIPPTSPANCVVQGLIGATVPPVIQANGGGFLGIIIQNGTNCIVQGLETAGDGGGNNVGLVQNGSFNTVSNCRIALSTATANSNGFAILMQGHDNLITNCVVGGVNKTSSEDVGVFIQFGTYNQRVMNSTIRYCGGAPRPSNPTQTGFGIHADGTWPPGMIPSSTPFIYVAGVPTNTLCEVGFCIISDCAWNLSDTFGGGPSGCEIGGGDRSWVHDCIVFNITANPAIYSGGTDMDPIDAGDIAATNILVERNFCYNCQGGLIDFASVNGGTPSVWGPSIVRYNLVVNCGQTNNIGNIAIQDESTGSQHQWYGNSFIQIILNAMGPGSVQNVQIESASTTQGFFANNIVWTVYPYFSWLTDSASSALVMNNNNWFSYGAGYNGGGSARYATLSITAAAVATFDQTGVTGDPLFPNTISSTSWSGGIVTVTTTLPHGQTGTFVGTIDGNNWYNGASPYAMNGIFNMTVTGANTFTFPLASNPTTGGFLASPGVWSLGTVSAMLQTSSWKLGSVSSACYRTGIDIAGTFGVDAGSTDFYGNGVTGAHLPNIGCDAYGNP